MRLRGNNSDEATFSLKSHGTGSAQTRSLKSGQFPFTHSELLASKRTYFEQPNCLSFPHVLVQAQNDSLIMKRMSVLKREGLVPIKGMDSDSSGVDQYIQTGLFRDILHKEMEEMAEQFMTNRTNNIAQLKKLGKVISTFFSFFFSYPSFRLYKSIMKKKLKNKLD